VPRLRISRRPPNFSNRRVPGIPTLPVLTATGSCRLSRRTLFRRYTSPGAAVGGSSRRSSCPSASRDQLFHRGKFFPRPRKSSVHFSKLRRTIRACSSPGAPPFLSHSPTRTVLRRFSRRLLEQNAGNLQRSLAARTGPRPAEWTTPAHSPN